MTDDKREGDDLFEDLDKFFAPIKDVDWESDEPGAAAPEPPRDEHVAVRSSEDPISIDEGEEEAEDDTAWYDTSELARIDEALGEDSGDESSVTPQAVSEMSSGGELGGEPEVESPILQVDDVRIVDEDDEEPSEEDLEAATEHFAESVRSEEDVPDEIAVMSDEDEVPIDASDSDEAGAEEIEGDILADLEEPEGGLRTVVVGTEGLGGPSWQDPASVEVGADIDRGPGIERDMPAAFLTAIVLVGLALGSLLIGKGAFAVVAALVVLVAQGELFGVLVKKHFQPATAVGLVAGALMMGGAYYHGEEGLLAMFALGGIATFLWFLAVPSIHRKHTMANVGLTIANLFYIPLLAGFVIVTLRVPGSDAKALVVAVIGLTFVYDTAAFLAGSVWGGSFFQRPLAPDTSPKKSWEGLIIATIVTVILSMALVPSFVGPFEDKRVEALFLAIVVAAAATIGDLAESLIKRDLGIKDMGSILPGHGGVLDRIDSLLFVAPAAFLLFRVIFA